METSSLSSMMQIVADTDLIAVFADPLEEDAVARNLVRLPLSEDGWNMESAVMFRSEVSGIKPFRWLIDKLGQ
jgi:DNA-binding transcriptional LysR family regulator